MLIIQCQRFEIHATCMWGLYKLDEESNGRFRWRQLLDDAGDVVVSGKKFDGPYLLMPGIHTRGGQLMTDEEAEALTGLRAPVCWDKIRDLM